MLDRGVQDGDGGGVAQYRNVGRIPVKEQSTRFGYSPSFSLSGTLVGTGSAVRG